MEDDTLWNKDSSEFKEMPFFNKRKSTFTPSAGQDTYLDFYIEAIHQEILNSLPKRSRYTNISKEELHCLRRLSNDPDIIIKKADKSSTIVILNKNDYIREVERQLHNETYYEKLDVEFSDTVEKNVLNCISEISEQNESIVKEFDALPDNISIPQFYILPKLHKSRDDALPLGYPGRPIVSACYSHTDHVSKFIDYILKPHMQSLPSYIKVTTDFIIKLKQFQVTSEKAYLVTLDVSSLYTNIPHEDGIEACRYFLENNGHSGSLSVDNVCALIELVMKNNYFKFSDISYRQKMGTATSSSMAPAYASLFMGKFEMDFMKICSEKPTLWLRF